MRGLISVLGIAAMVVGFGCGGDGPTSPSGSGTLNLRITDSPYSDAKAVLVTFSEASAHVSGEEGRRPLAFAGAATSLTCDLKKLEGADDLLGAGALPAGHYTMIRLVVSSATIYFDTPLPDGSPACAATVTPPAGRSASLNIPSGEVKLNRQFEVVEGAATTILLDFDGDRSIVALGNGGFRMTPVIGVVSVQ